MKDNLEYKIEYNIEYLKYKINFEALNNVSLTFSW